MGSLESVKSNLLRPGLEDALFDFLVPLLLSVGASPGELGHDGREMSPWLVWDWNTGGCKQAERKEDKEQGGEERSPGNGAGACSMRAGMMCQLCGSLSTLGTGSCPRTGSGAGLAGGRDRGHRTCRCSRLWGKAVPSCLPKHPAQGNDPRWSVCCSVWHHLCFYSFQWMEFVELIREREFRTPLSTMPPREASPWKRNCVLKHTENSKITFFCSQLSLPANHPFGFLVSAFSITAVKLQPYQMHGIKSKGHKHILLPREATQRWRVSA